ncbi:MAG: hypothetical protein EZS28_005203 [Streblomastix strix]|uniref:Uncharacterized protein n=1 Tax=Streblomastix strix TaxID=222440 RepID=A0A5J4WXR1_9EUKA|nr:MAG: hypothetical protein EZS28_005203 [Streblomastix strix]
MEEEQPTPDPYSVITSLPSSFIFPCVYTSSSSFEGRVIFGIQKDVCDGGIHDSRNGGNENKGKMKSFLFAFELKMDLFD